MGERNLDFDRQVTRTGTGCLKYDFAAERGKPSDVLPLWVADMDFPTSSYVIEALEKQVQHGIFGYSDAKEDYFEAVAAWMKKHHDWTVQKEWLVKTPGVVFALAMAIQAYTQPGDAVLVQQPVYYPFTEVIDLCLAHHTGFDGISFGSGSGNGFVSKVIRIKGKAAHAAGCPEKGVNALSAASLGLQALGLNRETFRDEDCVRVHPIMTRGGDLVNVVPDDVVLETLVRGKTLEAFSDAAEKTDRSFKAGALALGAGYRIETMPGYLPSLPQKFPEDVLEIAREVFGSDKVKEADLTAHGGGSTDVGDVQHCMPVLTSHTGGVSGGLHQVDFAIEDEEEAYIATAKLFALSAYRLLRNGARTAKEVVDGYQPRFKNREEYVAFMDGFNKVEEKI